VAFYARKTSTASCAVNAYHSTLLVCSFALPDSLPIRLPSESTLSKDRIHPLGLYRTVSWNNAIKLLEATYGDLVQRENLFRGLARIILSMARLPLPQVGSFRFHDDGTLTLTPGRTLPGEISEERSPKRDLPGAPGRTLIGFKLSSSICIHN
jgi:hypothetical protein